jgi:hypothetical protein
MVYSRAERVLIVEHYFASKSFAAPREEFIKYPDKEVPTKGNNTPNSNNISGHRKCLCIFEKVVGIYWKAVL